MVRKHIADPVFPRPTATIPPASPPTEPGGSTPITAASISPTGIGLTRVRSWTTGQPPLRTTVTVEKPKTIIARNISPDVGFDRSINPYRGCEHGCIYCFARPTHAFHDLSPGLDFESKLFAKPDAAALLREELAHPRYLCAPIAIGTNTDPYQPIE